MANIISTFGELVEFDFVDGPIIDENEKINQPLIDRGFPGPHKKFMLLTGWSLKGNWDRTSSKTKINVTQMEMSVKSVIEHINKQDEPYDGFAGFCLGFNFMVLFLNLAKYCKKELKMRHTLPYFLINFSGVMSNINFDWDGKFIPG